MATQTLEMMRAQREAEMVVRSFYETCGAVVLTTDFGHDANPDVTAAVVLDDNELVFVGILQVADVHDAKHEWVGKAEQDAFVALSEWYVETHDSEDADVRFDRCLISGAGDQIGELKHIDHVFKV